ncbi:Type 1 glutamine amidotransferase-like domain-containing protein [Shouchella lonarensis]|uniref:Cyanophycinase n=1 Tax=Shouchella lonarensis TaxID=1464122 RepID=A0A1G6NAD2_9BACI|nr:Type 1 glutamine amidotransferase-like domain-containing protein [Shouchella lonarensis]SDC64753.1 cyanophycinase [Shouchella lonarensis]
MKTLIFGGGGPPIAPDAVAIFTRHLPKDSNILIASLEREGWQAYMPKYTSGLMEAGYDNIDFFAVSGPDDSEALTQAIKQADALIIGGGDTVKYQQYFAADARVARQIKTMYEAGKPIMGFSAGALISPACCIISPNDNEAQSLLIKEGIGLLQDVAISVHYTAWQDRDNLSAGMRQTNITRGFGIDDDAYLLKVGDEYSCIGSVYVHTEREGRIEVQSMHVK